jgi:hypothetical protein
VISVESAGYHTWSVEFYATGPKTLTGPVRLVPLTVPRPTPLAPRPLNPLTTLLVYVHDKITGAEIPTAHITITWTSAAGLPTGFAAGPAASFTIPILAPPGQPIQVEVTAPGYQPWTHTAQTLPPGSTTVAVSLVPLAKTD